MLTASEKVLQKLVHMVTGEHLDDPDAIARRYKGFIDDDSLYDTLQDAQSELRPGTHATGLRCDSSRHYSSRAVAAQMLDGSWVGWCYWYGGGKHGDPGAVEWVEDAYDVEMAEVMEPVKKFTRIGGGT